MFRRKIQEEKQPLGVFCKTRVQAIDTMNKLKEFNKYVRLILNELPGKTCRFS